MSNTKPNPASAPLDTRRPLRIGAAGLLLGLGGFIVWAAWAPIDEGVPLPGTVAVESKRKAVQHLTGGMVAAIAVRDGDKVTAGQKLLALDTSVQQGQQQIIGSQLASLQAQADGIQRLLPLRQQQVSSLSSDISNLQPLVTEDLYPRNRYSEQLRQLSQLRAQLSGDQANLSQTRAQMRELAEKQAVIATEIRRADVRAPNDGVVLGMSVHTIGAVIPPGGKILELVPEGDSMVIDAQIPPHLIETVRAGLAAQLRFTALDHRKTPVINGKVDLVSADLITDSQGRSFYTARVSATTAELARLGSARLLPGMPVEVIVITGERSFLNYFLKPLSDSFALGFKER